MRRHPLKISYEINKASANYILFMLVALGYFFALLFTPMHEVTKSSKLLSFLFAVPAFVFEIMWLSADSYVSDLLKSRAKICRS